VYCEEGQPASFLACLVIPFCTGTTNAHLTPVFPLVSPTVNLRPDIRMSPPVGGKYDPTYLCFPLNLFAGKEPASDLRDWAAIRAWAGNLVTPLQPVLSK
jgi:hypothetical protein